MKVSSALSQARQDLDSKGVGSSKLDSLILLSHALFLLGNSHSKEWIIFNPDFDLNLQQQNLFFDFIARRKNREPVSHIIGRREFYGEDFFVSKDVLDPRPDSESLIELVLKNFPKQNEGFDILEVGVGSGCLIVTLLRLYKEARGFGLDISDEALKICQKNAQKHQVETRLNLAKSNLFSVLSSEKKFDLIISNPPYIASKEIADLEPEVKIYEPIIALDGGDDGFDFYRKIAASAANFLKQNGKIIIEIGFGQKDEIIKIFSANKFKFIESRLDLSGVNRALSFEIE
jgi:release factor glutamine methyltransferase